MNLRRSILEAAYRAGTGHVPSALSIVDIVDVLHAHVMRKNAAPAPLGWRDSFVLSKGHGVLALYAVLAQHGLYEWANLGSLPGHPERGDPGIECSTGSLGHGLPMAAGMAYGFRLAGRDTHVFCLVGDTEMEEGSCWEALHIAARRRLGNLTVIVDANGNSPNQISGEPFRCSLANKFAAFGWFVSTVDGHDRAALLRMLPPVSGDQPQAIIASTVKGKGVSAMETDPGAWHRRGPTGAELQDMVAALQ